MSSTVNADVQGLEPGPLFELWVFDATAFGGGVVRFQGVQDGQVMWQGAPYDAWPIEGDGFERTSEQQPRPVIRVGNLDGSITRLCLAFDDLVGAILTRHRVFAKYLDGQPDADPTNEFIPETWFIDRKSSETPESVEFELASALNFQGIQLPTGKIIANQCPYVYRGPRCNYVGPPVADELDVPTTDPAVDKCGKRLRSCKMRLWPDDVLNFGGYPAADLVRI